MKIEDSFHIIHRKRLTNRPGQKWQHLKLIAYAEGYVMVRASGAVPFVMKMREWCELPLVNTP